MAISIEELTVGIAEGAVGPLALALGAGVVVVALTARSGARLRRAFAGGVSARETAEAISPRRWLGVLERGWHDLVDEARAEYDADRGSAVAIRKPARATRRTRRHAATANGATVHPDSQAGIRKRDSRGRFQRRSPNGAAEA